MTDRLVLSIAEAAAVLGLSDDLVYELTERGELPCLRFGRRKVIPRRAIDLVIEHALEQFDPEVVVRRLAPSVDDLPPHVGAPSGPASPPAPVPRPRRRRRPTPPSKQMGLL